VSFAAIFDAAPKAFLSMDWRAEFFLSEDLTYLNAAGQGPLPRVSVRALEAAVDWKKLPHQIPDPLYFELPDRVRELIAQLIRAQPDEVALTTGASGGLCAVAAGIPWKPEDEVLVARGEFPAHFSTWVPLNSAGCLRLRIVEPREVFLTAEDFLQQIGPRTRLVSTSLVRFDDAARIDATRLAEACHAVGAALLLDISQCAGALPIDVRALGADFLVCAGYKWLLGPFGAGFFWVKSEHLSKMRPGPFYWMAAEGSDNFAALNFADPKPANAARRWDTAETSSFYNLAALDAGIELVLRIGPEKVLEHNHKLIDWLFARLPNDRFVPASPLDRARRGPYGCFRARTPEKTAEFYDKLRQENVITSLREGNIRVSPYVYNSERDIDRLISVVAI
jgi:selenocysteine lyase/cysteine desulfurase